jgi:hypothetical protein
MTRAEKQEVCLIPADRGDETDEFFVAYLEHKSIMREETDSLAQMLTIDCAPKGHCGVQWTTTNVNEHESRDTSETFMEDLCRK